MELNPKHFALLTRERKLKIAKQLLRDVIGEQSLDKLEMTKDCYDSTQLYVILWKYEARDDKFKVEIEVYQDDIQNSMIFDGENQTEVKVTVSVKNKNSWRMVESKNVSTAGIEYNSVKESLMYFERLLR